MSEDRPRAVRRVVTGHDAAGHSIISEDQALNWRGGVLTELWQSDRSPAAAHAYADTENTAPRLEPPPSGTVLRFFTLAPGLETLSRDSLEAEIAAAYDAMGGSHCRVDTRRHPGMHRTKTLDYIIVLEGTVTLLLDDGETDLHPFDVVIQRHTNHAWLNRTDRPALLACVLIDADPAI